MRNKYNWPLIIFLLTMLVMLMFGIKAVSGQDIPANSFVDVQVQYNYDNIGEPILAVSGSTIWNSNQFSYNGYTTGSLFTNAGYLFFPNESRTGVGEFKYAAAGATALPSATLDSTLYTLHFITLNVIDQYTITHSFEFNEGITRTKIRTGRIVNDTATDDEVPTAFENSILVYPNPTRDMATVEFKSNVNGRVDIYVYDVTGRQVLRRNTDMVAGTNRISLGSNDMATGLNLVRVVANDRVLANSTFVNR